MGPNNARINHSYSPQTFCAAHAGNRWQEVMWDELKFNTCRIIRTNPPWTESIPILPHACQLIKMATSNFFLEVEGLLPKPMICAFYVRGRVAPVPLFARESIYQPSTVSWTASDRENESLFVCEERKPNKKL